MIHAQGQDFEMLRSTLHSATTEDRHLSTKAAIVEYYKGTYTGRGKNGWKQNLVNDLSALTGMKAKSLEKRFDPQRLNNPENKNASQYADLGKKLPPVNVPKNIKGKSAKISIKATLWISGNPYDKDMDVTLDPEEAANLLNDAQFDSIVDAYGINPGVVGDLELHSIDIDFS